MITRYHCALNGQGLQDVDPAICVTDIQESAPPLRATTAAGLGDGQRLLRLSRGSLSVTVTFEVHAYDPARRKAIAQKACAWAREGWLTVSDRPGQRLRVICDRLPTVGSALRWTDPLTIGFTAYELPYWQELHPAQTIWTGRSGSATLSPAGSVPCCLEAEVTALGAVSRLTLAVNGRSMALTNLGLSAGQTLRLGYDEAHHRQFLRIGDASALDKRTAASADDLLLEPRQPNAVSLAADGEVKAILRGYGIWR